MNVIFESIQKHLPRIRFQYDVLPSFAQDWIVSVCVNKELWKAHGRAGLQEWFDSEFTDVVKIPFYTQLLQSLFGESSMILNITNKISSEPERFEHIRYSFVTTKGFSMVLIRYTLAEYFRTLVNIFVCVYPVYAYSTLSSFYCLLFTYLVMNNFHFVLHARLLPEVEAQTTTYETYIARLMSTCLVAYRFFFTKPEDEHFFVGVLVCVLLFDWAYDKMDLLSEKLIRKQVDVEIGRKFVLLLWVCCDVPCGMLLRTLAFCSVLVDLALEFTMLGVWFCVTRVVLVLTGCFWLLKSVWNHFDFSKTIRSELLTLAQHLDVRMESNRVAQNHQQKEQLDLLFDNFQLGTKNVLDGFHQEIAKQITISNKQTMRELLLSQTDQIRLSEAAIIQAQSERLGKCENLITLQQVKIQQLEAKFELAMENLFAAVKQSEESLLEKLSLEVRVAQQKNLKIAESNFKILRAENEQKLNGLKNGNNATTTTPNGAKKNSETPVRETKKQSSPTPTAVAAMDKEDNNRESECIICFESGTNFCMYIPCVHVNVCNQCQQKNQFKHCPTCKVGIQQVLL